MEGQVTPIKGKRSVGQLRKSPESTRTHIRQSAFNDEELERVEWAAKELGLPVAVFLRMAALKASKEILG